MYAKGSRYRNLPLLAPLNINGERPLVTQLRLIPDTPGQFLHTVRDHDRLDILAYKYYQDASRWWQICDANSQFAFPNDLLDRTPLVDETLVLDYPDALLRYNQLLSNLKALGIIEDPPDGTLADFISCSVIVTYLAAATRALILTAIATQKFHLLQSFEWLDGTDILEMFTFEDVALKTSWQQMLQMLQQVPGIVSLVGDMGTATLQLTYNSAVIGRMSIVNTIGQFGFAVPAALIQASGRVGSQITVPPNGNI